MDHCSQTVVSHNLPKTSRAASVFGYAAAFGICLVGNFQVRGEMEFVRVEVLRRERGREEYSMKAVHVTNFSLPY